MIIRTEYANFGKPEDLLRYMQEENIEVVTVESDTERCRRLGEDEGEVNELYSNSDNSNYLHNNIGVMP